MQDQNDLAFHRGGVAYRSLFVHWLLNPPPVPLIRDGQILHRNRRA
jgi:hypothetical protein